MDLPVDFSVKTNDDKFYNYHIADHRPLREEAGVGAALTIKRFGRSQKIKPLTIRIDMPLVLSHIPAGETDHMAFRYVVAIRWSF